MMMKEENKNGIPDIAGTLQAPKSSDTRFKPGQSGNPAGKRRGTRSHATRLVERLIEGEAEGLVQTAIDLAKERNIDALRLCISRLCPPRRSRAIKIKFSTIHNAEDVKKVHFEVLQAVASGKITPEEGATIAGLLESTRKAIETSEHENRISELEKIAAALGKIVK